MKITEQISALLASPAQVAPPADPVAGYLEDYLIELQRILDQRDLSAVFQPILDLRSQRYIAYEGLIRGPQNSPLHAPDYLFAAARHAGVTAQLELLAREVVIASFARLNLPARLFINASVGALHGDDSLAGSTLQHMERCGVPPSRVVIELTENQAVKDFSILRDQLRHYRELGFQIAMDDMGEGFSNLRMWSEVRPEFVKIDRHLIHGIADDPLKFQLVRAMHEIAVTCRTTLIAEGIETETEFATIRDLGIDCGQGFLIERPVAAPRLAPDPELLGRVQAGPLVIFPTHGDSGLRVTIRQVMRSIAPLTPKDDNDAVYRRFESEANLMALPVVENGVPLGLINRHGLIDRFARPFRRELYGKKSCRLLMDDAPLVVDHSVSAQEVARLLGNSRERSMQDGFIITDGGRYLGTGSTQALMTLITDLQIRAARYANPLTQLPGNVPISEHIDRLLASGNRFVACYCDLDHFKPFNDEYGYRRGDQIIQQLGAVLTRVADPRLDFVGHIGGDDFMVLLQSADWERRVQRALDLFARNLPVHLEEAHILAGGYIGEDRRGQPVFHPLPAVSVGCLPVEAGSFRSHHEVSSVVVEAKKQAKRTAGNSLFIDRRRYTPAGAVEITTA